MDTIPEHLKTESGTGCNQLHIAIRNKSYYIIEALMKNNEFLKGRDNLKRTPLHYAVIEHAIDICLMIIKKHPETINLYDEQFRDAMWYAIELGDEEIVQLFSEVPFFNLCFTNNKCVTYLHCAIQLNQRHICKLLIKGTKIETYDADDNDDDDNSPEYNDFHKDVELYERVSYAHPIHLECTNNENLTPLFYAVKLSNYEMVKLLVENNCEVSTTCHTSQTAVNCNNMDILKCLLLHGFDATFIEGDYLPLLLYSIKMKLYDNVFALLTVNEELTEKLINNWYNKTDTDALHLAIMCESLSMVNLLVECNADIYKTRLVSGNNPLHTAIKHKVYDCIDYLIKKDVNRKYMECNPINGGTIIHAATMANNSLIIETLFRHYDLRLPINGKYLISSASSPFIHKINYNGSTAIQEALINLQNGTYQPGKNNEAINCFKLLIDKNTDLNRMDNKYLRSIDKIIDTRCKRLFDIIRDADFDVNKLDKKNESIIYRAIRNGCSRTLDFIMEKKPNVNLSCNFYTPLSAAIYTYDIKIINKLLEHGAKVLVSPIGHAEDPIYAALTCRNTEIFKLVLDNLPSAHGLSKELLLKFDVFINCPKDIIDLLLHRMHADKIDLNNINFFSLMSIHHSDTLKSYIEKFKLDINVQDIYSELQFTPLHLAVNSYDSQTFKLLLIMGANPEILNAKGENCLIHAIRIKAYKIIEVLGQHQKIKFEDKYSGQTILQMALKDCNEKLIDVLKKIPFVNLTPYINEPDDVGQTVIYYTIKNSNLNLLKYCINLEANVMHTDKNGKTILHCACEHRSTMNIFEFLISEDVKIDPDALDKNNENAIHLLIRNQFIQYEQLRVKPLGLRDYIESNTITIFNLIKTDININQIDVESRSPLISAIIYGSEKMVITLCREVNINIDFDNEHVLSLFKNTNKMPIGKCYLAYKLFKQKKVLPEHLSDLYFEELNKMILENLKLSEIFEKSLDSDVKEYLMKNCMTRKRVLLTEYPIYSILIHSIIDNN